MALATKPRTEERAVRRIWRTPGSKFNLVWLGLSLVMYGCIYALYMHAIRTQPFPGPFTDPLRLFGIVAFCLVLVVAAYSLRRRFVRRLPGKVQNWLWVHTWFGVSSILVAFLHENYANILRDFRFTQMRFTEADLGMSALYALLLLVISGMIGRLLDIWQARVIAAEANSNGVGIVRAVQEKLLELELTVEHFSAGKSPAFKRYCSKALRNKISLPGTLPILAPDELGDFEHVHEVLTQRALLGRSLRRQKRARLVILAWRYVHIPLACLALTVIGYHSISELLKMLLH
ncbi:MAG TPA: hypothetical protein VJQ26_04280 [Ktedonobacteraceae bacterium]|nr:hypothetical protein [Ktedonobacteraceae bacterium]